MPEYGNRGQIITLSDLGTTISRWQYHGVDIFYPQKLVRRQRVQKLRGGMHLCFPNFGTVDPAFGLPQHGTLRDRKPDVVYDNGGLFHGEGLLSPACTSPCEVKTSIALEELGFSYSLMARVTRPSEHAWVNPGFHPYFNTPNPGASKVSQWPNQTNFVHGKRPTPTYEPMDGYVSVTIPGLAYVQMILSGNGWKKASKPKAVLWSDSENYLCVEPVTGVPSEFGTHVCQVLTEDWLEFKIQFTVMLTG